MIKYLVVHRSSNEDEVASYEDEDLSLRIIKGFHSKESAEKHIEDNNLPTSGEHSKEIIEVEFEDENPTE